MDRVHNHEALGAALRPIFAARTRDEWLRRLDAADVPHAPILGLDEALADPQARHLGIEQELHHPAEGKLRTIRTPILFDRQPGGGNATAPPVLNEHGAQIRAALAKDDVPGKNG
jgi:crotonobetainyl-CoA:carnitine CoA-transferase CaiB-like acyl-CoA transferase